MNYRITHQITQTSSETIAESFIEAKLLPCSDEHQLLLNFEINNSMHEPFFSIKNTFGFTSHRCRISKPFNELVITFTAEVQKKKHNHHPKNINNKEAHKLLSDSFFLIEHHLFLYKTKLTNWTQLNKKLPSLKSSQSFEQYISELLDTINQTLKYSKLSTPYNSIEQVLKEQTGNSIDYTHLFLATCKAQGIPSRFVFGYINTSKKLNGVGQLFSWAEAYLPLQGWVAYDVCNNKLVDEHYIKIGHGADYADCKGFTNILKSNTSSKTSHHIKIQSI